MREGAGQGVPQFSTCSSTPDSSFFVLRVALCCRIVDICLHICYM
jgi:hypothetical protein